MVDQLSESLDFTCPNCGGHGISAEISVPIKFNVTGMEKGELHLEIREDEDLDNILEKASYSVEEAQYHCSSCNKDVFYGTQTSFIEYIASGSYKTEM